MKKFLLIAVAAFGMLMTACSKDEVAQPVAEKSTVTFTVAAPELATRAHGDGLTATVLKYAVYNRVDGSKLFEGQPATLTNKTATVEIPFVNGMKYDVLFWAEAPASPYTVNWTTKTVAYTDAAALVSNSEAYDAFYAYVNDIPEITGPVTKSVELKRPFAQLNIITNDAAEAAQSGVEVKDVKVVVEGAYTDFDLANHKGLTKGTVTFGTAAAQTKTDVLAVNYLFPAAEKSLVDVEFTYTDEAGKLGAGEVKEFATVPIQRNYRTNIVGSLLTSDGTFNVEIKPGFDGEPGHEYDANHNVSLNGQNYNSFQEALAAAQAGDEISLNTDLALSLGSTRAELSGYYAVIDKDITLNLNGKHIEASVPDVTKNSGIFHVKNGAEFTIKGEGSIHLNTAKAVNCLATFINNDAGIVNLMGDIDWTIKALDYPDALIPCFVDNNSNVGNATLNIYAGTYTFHRNLFRNFSNAASHNNYATVATINIYGGTFNGKADDAGAIWNQKPSGNTPDGAGVINVYGGVFNNVEISNDFETGVVEKTPQQAFNEAAAAANGETVYITPVEGGYTLPSFNGKDINVVGLGDGVKINMQNQKPAVNANLRLENIELVFSNADYCGFQHIADSYYKDCTIVGQPFLYGNVVVFDNCTFEQDSPNSYNVWTYDAKDLTFNKCTFNSAGKSVLIYHETLGQTVTFNDCVLNASAPVAGKAAIEIDSSFPNGKAGNDYIVNINNTTANGFALGTVSCNSLWNEKKGDNCTVNLNGVKQAKTVVFEQAGLAAALTAGLAKVNVAAGNYTMPEPDMRGKNITIVGSKDAVIDATAVDARDQFVTGTTLAFEGVTINFGTVIYMGFANPASLTYKDCDINGLQFLYGAVKFDNCNLNSNGAEHCVSTYGANSVEFKECDFTYSDRCVNHYKDQPLDNANISYVGCTFTTTNASSKGAVEINSSSYTNGIAVNFTGCTAPAHGEMAFISGWDSVNGANATVTIDGVVTNVPQLAK
ncbi:MAG: hypothetical protein J6B41_03095 [Alistipes sp.]|nr:hypothetical protein [Alistipes sp.]